MLQVGSGTDIVLLNADGYTNLFETSIHQYPAPFVTFASYMPDHGFAPGSTFTEGFDLKTTPGTYPMTFNFLVTAGHPSAAGDVSSISGFRQSGTLKGGGGSAFVSFDIEDLQDDIGGVFLNADALGSGGYWLNPSNGRFEAWISNLSAGPGIYYLQVDAYSPNFQNAVTSNYYRAVVFYEATEFRNQLLAEVNEDRAANGLAPLVMDDLLNTAAQFHAQDMADKQFFSHTNLDDWTPWQRMKYYGIEYQTAGENIAVGHDTPVQVEEAWMDSPGHKANILNSSFNRIGLGIALIQPGDEYAPGYYWVQVFTN
jgi:uncharacterized protein YkwD